MQSIIEPKVFVGELKKAKLLNDFVLPESVVLYLPPGALPKTSAKISSQQQSILLSRVSRVGGQKIAVVTHLGIGAPSLTIFLEMLIALGARRFIAIGTAGALSAQLKLGDLVLCSRAWRGDGTSIRYIPGEDWSLASNSLCGRAQEVLHQRKISHQKISSWTTDAFFRETRVEVDRVQKLGAEVVEMEASALYTVAQYRGVEAASLFVISDQLVGESWQPQFRGFKENFSTLLNVAIETLSS